MSAITSAYPGRRKTCLRPGAVTFAEESFIIGRPSYSTSLYAESRYGASAETPTRVPDGVDVDRRSRARPAGRRRTRRDRRSRRSAPRAAPRRPGCAGPVRPGRRGRRCPAGWRSPVRSPSSSQHAGRGRARPSRCRRCPPAASPGRGGQRAKARNAASSSSNASMYEWAIVPTAGRPSAWAAATLLVPAKPTIAPSRAAWWPASAPWVRRSEKSTTGRPARGEDAPRRLGGDRRLVAELVEHDTSRRAAPAAAERSPPAAAPRPARSAPRARPAPRR